MPPVRERIETVRTETVRDTVVVLAPDSSFLRALLECDSSGNVLLKKILDYEAGDRLKPPRADIKDNVLTITAEADSVAIYLKLRDRYEARNMERLETVEVNRLTWWQEARIWIGNISLIAIILLIILNIRKIWKK